VINGVAADRDCREIAEGKVCRMLVSAGPAAIRFAATPDARLVWVPVGRRGDPEYVQPGSLSPEPPERTAFDPDADRAVGDGILAAAILAIVVATLLELARSRLVRVPRRTWIAMAAVFAGAAIVRWIGLSDHGQTWDEDVNWAAGRNYITNLLALDFRARSWTWNYEHPPVMKYLEGIAAQFADGYGPARALSAVWVSIGCALIVPIGARLYGMRAGVLAGSIAALLPPLVAHGQIVGHEAPTVMWWALGILLALTAFDGDADAEPSRWDLDRKLAVIGGVAGIACASRFVNGLLGPTCLAIVAAVAPAGASRARVLLRGLRALPLAAALAIYAVWPRLWLHPIDMLQDSLRKLAGTHSVEPFLGEMTATPGPSYFPLYLLATLPLGVLVGATAGVVRTAWRGTPWATRIAMAAWLLLPLGVMVSPVRQDGVRYVLPSVMALAMLAAAGWDAIGEQLVRRWRHARTALAAALALYLGSVLWRTHPYYLDYFGEQVGGAATVAAHRWFETAWWGEGVDRAVAYVDDNAAPGDVVYRACIEPVHLAWFRDDLWKSMTQDPRRARWLVAYAPLTAGCAIPPDARLVYEVENDGLVLARVYQR
jgi:4-amino-4-deoxy-L-arabinose transferase-like glycosyltransferase